MFDFEEVAESAGVEAAEPAAEGASGLVIEGAESAAEFAPEELDEFLGIGGVTELGAGPCFEEGVVVGEEALPCRVIAPCMQSLQQGGSCEWAVAESLFFGFGGHWGSCQLSVVSCQLSVVSCQLSVVSC